MVFLVSDEVKPKKGGPRMIVTGYSSGMVECRCMMATALNRKPFVKMSFSRVTASASTIRLNHITPGFAGRFYLKYRV